jgi:hypothetical protein
VKVVQTLREISAELLDRVFRQLLVQLYDLKQVATCTVFENNPKVVACLVPVEKFQNMPVVFQ